MKRQILLWGQKMQGGKLKWEEIVGEKEYHTSQANMPQTWGIINQAKVCQKEKKNKIFTSECKTMRAERYKYISSSSWTLWHLYHIMSSSQILYFPLNQPNKCHSEFRSEQNVWAKIWLNDVRESQSSLHWVKENNASSLQGAYTQRRGPEAYRKMCGNGSQL